MNRSEFAEPPQRIAVLDTETNWYDQVMSVGIAIADSVTFALTDRKYYILTPECSAGGMYASVLMKEGVCIDLQDSRECVMQSLSETLRANQIRHIFAYNALFDYKHLPELQGYDWYDIMRLAAYRQFNRFIPANADCYRTGRLKRNYGVQSVMRMIPGNRSYSEIHNAVCDAADELQIMQLLGCPLADYACAKISFPQKP